MIYERVILEKPNKFEDILDNEFETKTKISNLMSDIKPHQFYSDLYNLNVQNYITTNYDYAFIKSIESNSDINFPINEFSSEDVYSIRRLKKISNKKERKKNFWQIHGELNKPATIMLGLDHYCGEIGKIDNYIKGTYKYVSNKETISELSIEDKLKGKKFNGSSWIELFFNSNIHIIGFSFNYAEIDLWWIVNKRARMKRSKYGKMIKNKIIFYCDYIDTQFEGVLNCMDIEVVRISTSSIKKEKYNDYYKNVISLLAQKL